jgi:hypothetical protein
MSVPDWRPLTREEIREFVRAHEAMSDLKTRRIEAGLCPDCGEPARPQRLYCVTCAERQRQRVLAAYHARHPGAERRSGRRCGLCGRPGHYRPRCEERGGER